MIYLLRGTVLALLFVLAGCLHSASIPGDLSDTVAGDIRDINIPGTGISLSLVYIPAGSYAVGSPESEAGRNRDEGPQKTVVLDGYWISQFETTGEEFAVFRYRNRDSDTSAVAGPIYRVDAVSRPSPPYEDPAFGMGAERKPAVGMTQWGAMQYARWLGAKTGVFFRLPTEAEWETACRAGSDFVFGFGNDISLIEDYAWIQSNSEDRLQGVGQKRPNAWGLHDMHGNASEWTLDQYSDDFYATLNGDESVNPWARPTRLHPRTVRGGAYDDPALATRCAARLESTLKWKRRDPQIPKSFWWNTDSPFLGFRLVAPEAEMSARDQETFWAAVLKK